MTDPLLVELAVEAASVAVRTAFNADRSRSLRVRLLEGDESEELARALSHSLSETTDVGSFLESLGGEEGRAFLESSECREIVASACVFEIGGDASGLSDAETAFFLSYAHWVTDSANLDRHAVAGLFKGIVSGVDRYLRSSVETGSVAAADLRNELRANAMEQRLNSIALMIGALEGDSAPTTEAIESFEREFCRQVAHREGQVLPPSYQGHQRLPINQVYVSPNTCLVPAAGDSPPQLKLRDLVRRHHRLVVLGDPGGGKSTLTQKLCFDHCNEQAETKTPVFRMLLRSVYSAPDSARESLWESIVKLATDRYSMEQPSEQLIAHLFRAGRAIIAFDGLDEILDLGVRRDAAADIESFANLYPAVQVVVTSRSVGYEQSQLRRDSFDVSELQPFQEPEVREFVRRWFSIEETLSADEITRIEEEFMLQSRDVEEIRSNPLMLGLMCNLYRGESSIPSNRPEIFEKCAEMLFSRWDTQRSIGEPLPFASRLRPALNHLANWIYFDPELSSGVTEPQLVAESADFLQRWSYPERGEAVAAAQSFVDLCKGRAWVFTNTGTSAGGNELFQFTHRVFLEFFTAESMVGENPTANGLAEKLFPLVAKRESAVVCQLAIQVLYRRSPQALESLISALFECEQSDAVEDDQTDLEPSIAVSVFLVELLRFVFPSPESTVRIVDSFLMECERMFPALDSRRTERYPGYLTNESVLADGFRAIFEVGAEARTVVNGRLSQWANDGLRDESRRDFVVAFVFSSPRTLLRSVPEDAERGSFEAVIQENRDRLVDAAGANFELAFEMVFLEWLSVKDFVRHWGTAGLFLSAGLAFRVGVRRISIAINAAHEVIKGRKPVEGRQRFERCLSAIGKELLSDRTPFRLEEPIIELRFEIPESDYRQDVLSSEVLFGAFCVWAVEYEEIMSRGDPPGEDFYLETGNRALDDIRSVVASRGREPAKQIDLLSQWFEGDELDEARNWVTLQRNFLET